MTDRSIIINIHIDDDAAQGDEYELAWETAIDAFQHFALEGVSYMINDGVVLDTPYWCSEGFVLPAGLYASRVKDDDEDQVLVNGAWVTLIEPSSLQASEPVESVPMSTTLPPPPPEPLTLTRRPHRAATVTPAILGDEVRIGSLTDRWVLDSTLAGITVSDSLVLASFDEVLATLPVFYATHVLGVSITVRPVDAAEGQASAPMEWVVNVPLQSVTGAPASASPLPPPDGKVVAFEAQAPYGESLWPTLDSAIKFVTYLVAER